MSVQNYEEILTKRRNLKLLLITSSIVSDITMIVSTKIRKKEKEKEEKINFTNNEKIIQLSSKEL